MAGKSEEEEIHTRRREKVQIGFRSTDTQTAEEREIIPPCGWQKPLAGDCRLQARWLMLLTDLLRIWNRGQEQINRQTLHWQIKSWPISAPGFDAGLLSSRAVHEWRNPASSSSWSKGAMIYCLFTHTPSPPVSAKRGSCRLNATMGWTVTFLAVGECCSCV